MYGVTGVNFIDHSLNQGAPAGHELADTPSGCESNGAAVGDESPLLRVITTLTSLTCEDSPS